MPALPNPRHEAVAQEYVALIEDKTEKPSLTKAYQNVYGVPYESANAHVGRVVNGGVKNRINEILEAQLGLTDDYLLNFGRDKFLNSEDLNVGLKAWRTFLEIKGIIGQETGVSIANIVFNEQIVQAPTSDNVASSITTPETQTK